MLMFIMIHLPGHTQNIYKRDSLVQVLSRQSEDSNKVNTLLKLGDLYSRTKPDSSIYYYEKGGALSKSINYPIGTLKYISNITEALNLQSKYKYALELNLESIKIATRLKLPKRIAAAYANTGVSYYFMADYKTSTDYLIKAIKILEKEPLENIKDQHNLAGLYANVAGIFSEIKKDDEAYIYGLKGIEICRNISDSATLTRALNNVSTLLFNKKKYDSALICARQANDIAAATDNTASSASACITIANVYENLGNYDSVLYFAEKGLTLSKSLEDSDGINKSLIFKAIYFFNKKEYPTAKTLTEEALHIAQLNHLDNHIDMQYLLLSDIELAIGNLEGYHRYRLLSDSMKEAVLSAEILKATEELDTKYGVEKKEQQLKLQSTKLANNRLWMGFLGILIAAILLIFFTANRSYNRKKKILEQEKILQQQQIDQLEKDKQLMATKAVLKGQEEERTRLAKDLHDGLGGILSGVKYSLTNMKDNMIISAENAERFERTMTMLDQSISELRRVAHNMMPESLTKVGLDKALQDICNSINKSGTLQLTYQSFELHDETIPQDKASVIYRVIQELLNNMLKHASASKALLQLIRKDHTLSITVEDNGKGFNKEILLNNTGMGYGNLLNRITYLEGTIDVQTAPGDGTSVNIEIPNITA